LKLKLVPAPERRMPSLPLRGVPAVPLVPVAVHAEASQRSRECLEQALAARSRIRAALRRILRLTTLRSRSVGAHSVARRCRGARELARGPLDIDPDLPKRTPCSASSPATTTTTGQKRSAVSARRVKREPLSPHSASVVRPPFWLSRRPPHPGGPAAGNPRARRGSALPDVAPHASRMLCRYGVRGRSARGRPEGRGARSRTSGSDGRSSGCCGHMVAVMPRPWTAPRRR
jgi:hypothetical protein